jgi:transcriptional regulator with XRE-family HTH domain
MNDRGRTIRRRRLARELRQWRDRAGMTADDAARALICGAGTISRMENGQSGDPYRVKGLFELYGAPPETVADMIDIAREGRRRPSTVRKPYHDFVPKRLAEYYELEDEAESLSMLEGECVPGLIETADYARALIAGFTPHVQADEVDRLLEIRIARQERVMGPDPLRLRVVLGEAALYTQVGGPKVLREQLKHLLHLVGEQPNIEIRVLPFSTGARPALGRNFTIMSFPDREDPDVIFAESVSHFVLEDEIDEVAKFRAAYNQLWKAALDGSRSAKLIAKAVSEVT